MTASRRAWGFWLLVAVQVAIPASYYLGGAARDDERFAWRMFSAVRFRDCQVQAFDQEPGATRPIELQRELHASWIGLLRRGRPSVIEKFLRSRCDSPGRVGAALLRTCREVDGVLRSPERFQVGCSDGRASTLREGP